MDNTSASISAEFGKDHGLLHEVVVTGRKVGAGQKFYSLLAHNEALFRRIVEEVMQMVVATQPFDPVSFIGKGWSLIPEEHEARCDSLVDVDCRRVSFETCLEKEEPSIKGEEKLARLKTSGQIRLGARVFMGLWTDYQEQERKVDSVLERLFTEKGITYLDFFGDVLLDPGGHRFVLYLFRGGGGVWYWGYLWLKCGWDAHRRSVSLASQDSVLEDKSS